MLKPWEQRKALITLFEECKPGEIREENGLYIAPIVIQSSPDAEIVLRKDQDWLKIYEVGFDYSIEHHRAADLEVWPGILGLLVKGSIFYLMDKDPYRQIIDRVRELEREGGGELKQASEKKVLIPEAFLEQAVHVVNMFDQVNTQGGVARFFENRGVLLEKAVEKLRKILIDSDKKTLLTAKQAK